MKITSIIIIAVFTLLGSFDAQAQNTPNAVVQQTLINAMWQETEWHSLNSSIYVAVGLILLAMSIPLRKKDYGIVGMVYGAVLILSAIFIYAGDNLAVTRYQKEFEKRAGKIAEMLENPKVEIWSAIKGKDGVFVDLWIKEKTSEEAQIILGKQVEVISIIKESEIVTLTPLMLANLAPLNIKIAGQPTGELIAKK